MQDYLILFQTKTVFYFNTNCKATEGGGGGIKMKIGFINQNKIIVK